MQSIMGIGTALYGKKEKLSDGSYIATKWIIFLLMPIFPVESYRVWRGNTSVVLLGAKTEYKMIKIALNYTQIRNTYLISWGGLFIVILLIYFFNL